MDKVLFKKITLLYTSFIILISIIPIPKLPLPEFNLFQWDKFFHLIVYLIMSFMWLRLGYLKSKIFKWIYVFIVILVGFFTELCQGILPIGRYFEIADIIANFIGIFTGTSISYFYIFKNKPS